MLVLAQAENADGLTIDCCSFSRLGGNAALLHGFVRRAVIANNVFFSLGANVSRAGLRLCLSGVSRYHDYVCRPLLHARASVTRANVVVCWPVVCWPEY